jgi:hypothetical protein
MNELVKATFCDGRINGFQILPVDIFQAALLKAVIKEVLDVQHSGKSILNSRKIAQQILNRPDMFEPMTIDSFAPHYIEWALVAFVRQVLWELFESPEYFGKRECCALKVQPRG